MKKIKKKKKFQHTFVIISAWYQLLHFSLSGIAQCANNIFCFYSLFYIFFTYLTTFSKQTSFLLNKKNFHSLL